MEFLSGQEYPPHGDDRCRRNRRRSTRLAATDPDAKGSPGDSKSTTWTKTAERYRTEPEAGGGKGEGTTELSRRALEEQEKRDTALARYHHYEIASAAFQIGIVLASATVITGMIVLAYLAGGSRDGLGIGFTAIGLFAPHAVHLF